MTNSAPPPNVVSVDAIAKSYQRILRSLRMLRAYTGAMAGRFSLLIPGVILYGAFDSFYTQAEHSIGPFVFVIGFISILGLLFLSPFFLVFRKLSTGSRKTAWFTLVILAGFVFLEIFDITITVTEFESELLPAYIMASVVIMYVLSVAALGVVEIIRNSKHTHSPWFFSDAYYSGLRVDIYRVMGVIISSNNFRLKSRKALAYAFLAFAFEGCAFFGYFEAPGNVQQRIDKLHETLKAGHNVTISSPRVLGELIGGLVGAFIAAQIALALAKRFRTRSRRLSMQSAEEAITSDSRPPILFLRPFRDDQVSLATAKIPWYIRIVDPGVQANTLEELIVRNYSHLGPLIAMGNPRDLVTAGSPDSKKMPIGVSREYVTEHQWKDHILSWMRRASTIIVAVDESENLLWEIEEITAHDYLTKTIFLIPPGVQTQAALLNRLGEKLGVHLDVSMMVNRDNRIALFYRSRRVVGLCRGQNGQYYVMTSQRVTEIEYELTMRAARSFQRDEGLGIGSESLASQKQSPPLKTAEPSLTSES